VSVSQILQNLRGATPIGIALFLMGCASVRPVLSSRLESKQLVGHWTSGSDTMDIYCSGAFSYELKPGDYVLGDLRARKSTGGFIAEMNEDEFIVGPHFPFKEVFKVQKWPHKVDDTVRMTVDDQQWVRESYTPCSSRD
jgi:hypothetical protein